ncbi:MAG: hypothetical protein L0L22_12170 [Staphylococcus equorum]|nr:hypothetical protein [Staphylococcus equorum]MDN6571739.1 hypothetical protein [Staphylococcus equorum]
MGIFCGVVFAALIIAIFLGPERFHRELITPHDETEENDEENFSNNNLVFKQKLEVTYKD